MDTKISQNPRSVRARQAMQDALKELLKTTPFAKITITQIAKQAGFARHTFYNHYETKEDLLNAYIDAIVEKVFSRVVQWDIVSENLEGDTKFGVKFFQTWKEHAEAVEILNTLDIDALLVDRLRVYFTNYYYRYGSQEITGMGVEMAKYLINFNAYSFAGILTQWFKDDMKYSPELMGQFLNHFAGIGRVNSAIEKFKDLIK